MCTRGASSLPKKLSLLSKYSVAIYFTDYFKIQEIHPIKFSKSVL